MENANSLLQNRVDFLSKSNEKIAKNWISKVCPNILWKKIVYIKYIVFNLERTPVQNTPGLTSYITIDIYIYKIFIGGEILKWDLHVQFVFETGSIKNQSGQSEISQNLTRTLVFGGFPKKGYSQIRNHPFVDRIFHDKPSILRYPYLWKSPFCI